MKTLKEILSTDGIVFFGGAGVSTESGIPDFRSVDGLYNQKYDYPPETILSHSFFLEHTKEFFKFYREKILIGGIKPNKAHLALAKLEADGKLLSVITQNIDGLHTKAGSKRVWELHGTVMSNHCLSCGRFHPLETILQTDGVPLCSCGGYIKPDVVLYEEALDEETIRGAVHDLSKAKTLIVGGTSLNVYPAAGLLQYFRGETIVLINKSETPFDRQADLIIREPIGQTLGDALGM